ncbi:hypothetical protein B484DRAFT_458183 [Ochromonadaceae sp. CCMP2298]|nr:hypothetical protein B484DRAFT_458183 [Ochromonadaceae sp. CCMP2298]|mmetsp:Transcript_30688/g.67800  ORF Transcript_30688/g.67800 Transcript_30688/m.67800 type:complete len:287 (+) Transcript_30688:55-915(+)
MMFACVAISCLLALARGETPIYAGELQLQEGIEDFVTNPVNYEVNDLPTSWDWREKGLLTTDLNQHIPVYCGSCWAHATASTLGDRIKILTNGMQRDVIPSIQVLLNCGTAGSCGGGDVHAAMRWIHENGIPDTTCQAYTSTDGNCSAINTCKTCDGDGCSAVPEASYQKITVSEYGRVLGDDNIRAEIKSRGPVACYINSNCLHDYTGGVDMYDQNEDGGPCVPKYFNHAIQLNGWGTDENGTDYWVARNSWGTYWGEKGFFRVVRGGAYDPIGCYWAVPDVPTF